MCIVHTHTHTTGDNPQPLLPAAFQVQEVPEDLLHPKRSKVYTVKTLERVPAHCLFLQADGSVGFFIQPQGEWQEVLELQAVLASLSKVRADASELEMQLGRGPVVREVTGPQREVAVRFTLRAFKLPALDRNVFSKASSDPYYVLKARDANGFMHLLGKSKVISKNLDPEWEMIEVSAEALGDYRLLRVEVWDHDIALDDDQIGVVDLELPEDLGMALGQGALPLEKTFSIPSHPLTGPLAEAFEDGAGTLEGSYTLIEGGAPLVSSAAKKKGFFGRTPVSPPPSPPAELEASQIADLEAELADLRKDEAVLHGEVVRLKTGGMLECREAVAAACRTVEEDEKRQAEEEVAKKEAKKNPKKKGGIMTRLSGRMRKGISLGDVIHSVDDLVHDAMDDLAGVGDDFDEEAGRGGTGTHEVIPVDMSDETLAWPRFVPVIRLIRRRTKSDCCSWANKNAQAFFTVKYQQEVAECEVQREHVVTSPMDVHEKLSVHYHKQLMRGWPHAKIMTQFSDVSCGLVVVWKRCKKFTGGYSEAKLKFAWMVNIVILVTIIALLLWDILSYYGEIPFGDVLGAMVVADLTGLASALFIPLLVKTLLRVMYERSAAKEKRKAAELERRNDKRRFVVKGAEPAHAAPAAAEVQPGQPMLAALAASKTPASMFPFIDAALTEHAQRYEVARHIVRRTYSAYERLPLGVTVNHPERGRGIVVEVMPDLRRVVLFDKGGERHRYSPHSLYKLMEDQKKTGGPACSGNYDREVATTATGSEPELHHTLQIIRAGESAALAVLERDEAHKIEELNQLRALPSHALRQRAIERILARQRRKRDVEREKTERLAALEEQLQLTDNGKASFVDTMARAVVEGQAFAHLAVIASTFKDERWLCDLEEAAQAKSTQQLRLELVSLREGGAQDDTPGESPVDQKMALVLAQLSARGVALGTVDDTAIAAELFAQDGHVGRTVNRLMNRQRAGAIVVNPSAGGAAAGGAADPNQAAALEKEHEDLVWQLVDARQQKKRDDKDKAAHVLAQRGIKVVEEPKEEHPLAMIGGGAGGKDPYAAGKMAAQLAATEQRHADHDNELNKVEELLRKLDKERSSSLVAGLTDRKQALQEEEQQWEAASQASHASQTAAQAASQALQAAGAMQASEGMQAMLASQTSRGLRPSQTTEAIEEAVEDARVVQARRAREAHLQACAEACAHGSHRPARPGGRASPAPSVGSVGSVGSSPVLAGGGSHSKRFRGPLPDHMPPAPEPTSQMLRSSSSQALIRARRGNSGATTPTRAAVEHAKRVMGESSEEGAKQLEAASRTSSFASRTRSANAPAPNRIALRRPSENTGAVTPLQKPARHKSCSPRSVSSADSDGYRSAHDLSLPRWASEPLDTLAAQRLSAPQRSSSSLSRGVMETTMETTSVYVGGQQEFVSRPVPDAPPRTMRLVMGTRRTSKLRPARAKTRPDSGFRPSSGWD